MGSALLHSYMLVFPEGCLLRYKTLGLRQKEKNCFGSGALEGMQALARKNTRVSAISGKWKAKQRLEAMKWKCGFDSWTI